MTEDMYLRIKQVTAKTGLSRATIYGMMDRDTFPAKTALGVRAVGWLASEIEQWMRERKVVEKIGVEAAPGRKAAKRRASIENKGAKSTESVFPSPSAVLQKMTGEGVVTADTEAWGINEAPPTEEEMTVLRSARYLHKKQINHTPATSVAKRPDVDVSRRLTDVVPARVATKIQLFSNRKKSV